MDVDCMFIVDLTNCSNCRDLCLGPVIFPCGHLICRKCVRQIIVREGLPAHCSSCQQIIPLVQGKTISDKIDNMYKDLIVEKMVYECLRQVRKRSCNQCHETKVTHVCLDCRHYLCDTCSSVHSARERSYAHKQQTLPTTWTTAEIQSQSDSSGLEALCRNIECCQGAEVTIVDTQTTRSEIEKILYDQICQLKNSGKDVDKLIKNLQKFKVRLTIKQQILGMYAAELAKHDQSLVQTETFANRVRQIKKDSIPLFPHLAALEGCIRVLGHTSKGEAYQQATENYWLQCIQKWYPHLHSQTYFLPPFHFNRVSYCVENIAGKQVLVPQTPQPVAAGRRNHGNLTFPPVSVSDVRDDRALQRVLHGMRSLADNGQQKEVMFVVSQLQFDNYLGEHGFARAAALLPRPSTLPEHFRQQHYDKGHFDVLIIHRQHGLFILEINSVGENFGLRKMFKKQEDDLLIKKVEKVTQQLYKAEVVLRHLTSDLKSKINITKCLVMPNIKSSQLRAIMKHPSAGKVLCQCLGVRNVDDAVKLCLLSDQLSDNQLSSEINKSFLQGLRLWWQHLVRASGTEPSMTSALYEQLLARFCGPATTVDVHSGTAQRLNIRTLGEAVSETGERVARLVLFPQQVDILKWSLDRAFLHGPPGTGKTIVLIMQGLTWLQRGHDVHVVSTCDESRAAATVIRHQLQETVKTSTSKSRVHRHQFDFEKDGEMETAVRRLKSLSEGRQLCVIADEAVYYRELFTKFCDQLIKQVPGVFIWGASVHHDVRPLCLEEVKLTTPLRSPPAVVREVMKSRQIKYKLVHDYTVSDVPVPTEGPPVMRIKHHDGQSGHIGHWQHDCVECGHEVARVLTELDVGQTGDSNCPPPLKYRDVLVLCLGHPTDDRVDSNGQVSTAAIGLVQGLRDRHVPVRVLEEGDEAAIRDTALGVGDQVTVANWCDVLGLERKVVVVETETGVPDLFERLHAMSRCTSQLVVIDW